MLWTTETQWIWLGCAVCVNVGGNYSQSIQPYLGPWEWKHDFPYLSQAVLTLKMANVSVCLLLCWLWYVGYFGCVIHNFSRRVFSTRMLRWLSNETCFFWKFSHFHLCMLFLEKLLIILLAKQANVKQQKCSIMYKTLWQCLSAKCCFSHHKYLRFKFQHTHLLSLKNGLLRCVILKYEYWTKTHSYS